MLKIIALVSFLQWMFPVTEQPARTPELTCPTISSLQKDAQTGTSVTYVWTHAYSGAQYRVWYVRQEDNAFGGYFYTYNNVYEFSGLSAGHYTFYIQTVCGSETSAWIGIEDVISG